MIWLPSYDFREALHALMPFTHVCLGWIADEGS
jgi:hypothetical protein